MVQYKLLTCLLALSLLTVNWRMSDTHVVTTKIPDSIDPTAILKELQDQLSFIALNPVINGITHVPTDAAIYEDEWLSTSHTQDPIETYEISGAIAFIPGIGPLGQNGIQFRTWLGNMEYGVRTKANASFGVSVRSQWSVRPATTDVEKGTHVGFFSGISADQDIEWTLSVERTAECVWWMMPFVTYTYDAVHVSVGRDLLKPAGTENTIP